MMRKLFIILALFFTTIVQAQNNTAGKAFTAFKERFLDAWWQQHPASAIAAGYGKYYEILPIPDSAYFTGAVVFYNKWLNDLHRINSNVLAENDRISYNMIENQLRKNRWEIDTFRIQHWDASQYNMGGACFNILTQPYAPLDQRLLTISRRLEHAESYYAAALKNLTQPTKEHLELAIRQNEDSLSVFGKQLTDSIAVSHLTTAEKQTLNQHIELTINAISNYIAGLKTILGDKQHAFRDFRIGEKLFNQKFRYDIVTDYSSKEIFNKALAAKKQYHKEMFGLANKLWPKYCSDLPKPKDSLVLIKTIIDRISLNHISPAQLFDTLNQQVYDLKKFIIQKDLFDFDTTAPIEVRKMPAFASGVTLASANRPLPYQKETIAYYNIADLSAMAPGKAESQLREHNDYILQVLTIHEAVPGHCLQGIYNSRKSPDIIKSVFYNGPMAEGWAVYSERMMLENGWANHSPEMWLMYYKWSLRVCANVIVDYGMHCLNYTKEDIENLLKNEAFQEEAQVEEKYYRAKVSQVQLCSYFTGATEIAALREVYKKKMGVKFMLKDFHEKFLSYGTAPVKFIRQAMLKKE